MPGEIVGTIVLVLVIDLIQVFFPPNLPGARAAQTGAELRLARHFASECFEVML